jgi:glycerol-3-phosphate dehydrogenase
MVNAAGPWADHLARTITPRIEVPTLECVQGSHIILNCASPGAIYYVESPRDGRAVFVMPWHGKLMVGTTETRFRGDPSTVTPSATEVHYLLGVLKHYFPRFRPNDACEVESSFAGLRVLPGGAGHAFHRSRETLLITDRAVHPRVLSVYGGKLTTWRAVAARAMHRIAGSLPKRRPVARTDELRLN